MTKSHEKIVLKYERAWTELFPLLKNAQNVPVDTKHRFPIKFSDPERRCQHSPGAHCCRAAQFAFIVFMRVVIGYIAQWRKQWFREIKVFKKCPKVNPYCNAIFDPILFKPFLDGAKWPKFCAKYFSLSKKSNIGCIFFICLWSIVKGWSENYEIRTMYASCHEQKLHICLLILTEVMVDLIFLNTRSQVMCIQTNVFLV